MSFFNRIIFLLSTKNIPFLLQIGPTLLGTVRSLGPNKDKFKIATWSQTNYGNYNGIEEAWKHQELKLQTDKWNEHKLNYSYSNISAQ